MEALGDLSGGERVPDAGSHRKTVHHSAEAKARGSLAGYLKLTSRRYFHLNAPLVER